MDNGNQQIIGSDYLNQIAPKPVKKFGFFQQKPVIIGAICLGVLVIVMVLSLITSLLSGGTSQTKHLSARLQSTQETVKSATNNIKSTKLRAMNSNLAIYLTNTIRDFTPILKVNGIEVKKIDKSILASESNTKMLATLEDARLNAIYDRTYAREMAYQLDTILTLTRQIYKSSSSKTTKDFLNNAYTTLEPTQKQFADFNAADG